MMNPIIRMVPKEQEVRRVFVTSEMIDAGMRGYASSPHRYKSHNLMTRSVMKDILEAVMSLT